MQICEREGLHQVDLLAPARTKITNAEYEARESGQIAMDARNKKIRAAQMIPRNTIFQTRKQFLRDAILDAADRASTLEEFREILRDKYNIELKDRRGRFSYLHPDRQKYITGRALGIDYEWPVIEANIRHRLEHGADRTRQSLVSQIDDAMKSRGISYVNKVRSSNVRKLSESIAFLQEAGFSSRDELDAALELSTDALEAAEASLSATEVSLSRTNRAIRASGAYLSNRSAWRAYRASPDRKAFYMAHRRELEACNEARKELKEIFPDGKAPSLNELKAEKQRLVAERRAQPLRLQAA
jgi:hypothetical protein